MKKITTILFLASIIFLAIFIDRSLVANGVRGGLLQQPTIGNQIDNLPNHLKLKKDKSKILKSVAIENSNETFVKYSYVGDETVKEKDEISKNENAVIYKKTKVKDRLVGDVKIYIDNNFVQDDGKWHYIEYATTTQQAFDLQTVSLGKRIVKILISQVTATNINVGNGDGYVQYYPSTSWSVAHNASNGSAVTTIAEPLELTVAKLTGDNYNIIRNYVPVRTGGTVGSTDNVLAAALYIKEGYGTRYAGCTDAYGYMTVVETTSASSTALALSDYSQIGTTEAIDSGSRIAYADYALDGWNHFNFNSTGIGFIKKNGATSSCGTETGWTCLGLRAGHDNTNNVYCGVTGTYNTFGWHSSDATDSSERPYLMVTLSSPITNSLPQEMSIME